MKKWGLGKLAAALCLLLFCTSFAGNAWAAAGESALQISASAAVVADLDSGELLYEKNSSETFAPANLTKIMTVLLLAENYDLSEKVSFSEILYQTEESGTRLGLQPGEEITLYDAACAIWLGNADDVANGVAEYAAGSREAFAEQMNQRAQELGCQNTSFSDPNGYYSQNQYTCASDLRLILQAAYQNAAFREISGLTEYEIPATNLTESSRYLQTGQQLLQTDSGFWQEYCVGGIESAASGGTEHLTAFCSSGGRNLILVVLGAADAQTAASEAALLAEYGFSQDTAADAGESVPEPETDGEEVLVLTQEAAGTETSAQENFETQSAEESGETQNTENGLAATLKLWFAVLLERAGDALQDLLDYAGEDKRLTMAFIDGVLVLVLVLLLVRSIILKVRKVRDTKIRRKRKSEERRIRIQEAEIARMRAEEVEKELETERKKKARESKDRLK